VDDGHRRDSDVPRRGQYEGPVLCRQRPGRVSSVRAFIFVECGTFELNLIAMIQMSDEARDGHAQLIERAEIANLVRSRMDSLGIDTIDYDDVSEKRGSLSYVIINPSCDLKLEEGDIM
jgi:potassium channel subfamily T protein 1